MMVKARRYLSSVWYTSRHPLGYVLVPLSWLFRAVVSIRRFVYRHHLATIYHPGIPVIVVGNITTGGTGKTPLVIWLAGFLRSHGFRPGIVVRGYGGQATVWLQWVQPDSDPNTVGDEAVLLARRTGCPVVAAPDRTAAVKALMATTDCNLILSDDGLQHYALGRDVEIAVMDGARGYGNGHCLPAGPLREPVSRLGNVDLVVEHVSGRKAENGGGRYAMWLVPGDPRDAADKRQDAISVDDFKRSVVHAVCGIGNPDRFFRTLIKLGLAIKTHPFPDHHPFQASDILFEDRFPVLMTEKDAVKCRDFAESRHWYLPVDANLEPAFGTRLLTLLRGMPIGQKTS